MDADRENRMDGMADELMVGCTPQVLISRFIEGEKAEAALYAQIAQCVPCEELRRIIMHMAEHERRQMEMIEGLSHCFGVMPGYPAGVVTAYAEDEKKEEKKGKEKK